MLTPIPSPLYAWLTRLAQAVPNRSALTFLELLVGAMITDRVRRFPARTAGPPSPQMPRYCWVFKFVTQSY
jgi:hypothetical protein